MDDRVDAEGDVGEPDACTPPLAIAVVTETFPPDVNGVAVTLARLLAELARQGHRIALHRVRHRSDGRDGAPATRAEGLAFERGLPGLPLPWYPDLKLGLPAGPLLRNAWRSDRPDVVHVATEGPLGASALRAARALGIPVTMDFRTNFHVYTAHYGMPWLAQPVLGWLRRLHNQADATMAPTDALAAELRETGFERVSAVGRGVDVAQFSPALRSEALRAQWGVAPHDPVVGYVGRLAAEKNLDLLLAAFERVRRSQPRARLLLVGDGPMRAAVAARAPDAILAGSRRGEDLAAHYASADLFVFPSLSETYGNVIAEAMASGLPVVAFDRGAATQLIRHGLDGLVAHPDDADGFALMALQLSMSPPRRAAIGASARRRALDCGWPAVARSFEAVLREAIVRGAPQHAAALARRAVVAS